MSDRAQSRAFAIALQTPPRQVEALRAAIEQAIAEGLTLEQAKPRLEQALATSGFTFWPIWYPNGWSPTRPDDSMPKEPASSADVMADLILSGLRVAMKAPSIDHLPPEVVYRDAAALTAIFSKHVADNHQEYLGLWASLLEPFAAGVVDLVEGRDTKAGEGSSGGQEPSGNDLP